MRVTGQLGLVPLVLVYSGLWLVLFGRWAGLFLTVHGTDAETLFGGVKAAVEAMRALPVYLLIRTF